MALKVTVFGFLRKVLLMPKWGKKGHFLVKNQCVKG